MKGKIIAVILLLLLLLHQFDYGTMERVSAKMKSGNMVTLTQAGQVIDSITYNGKTIEAVYSNKSYPGNDPTYSCAAFIKKFYSTVYGISVYNLNSPTSKPLIYENKGSFSLTSDPQVGDIIRDNTRTHWAIVKSIDNNKIHVIQQSYKSGSSAWINCTIDRNDTGFSYFTYSNRVAETIDIDTTVPAADAALVANGTYNLIHASNSEFMNATDLENNWVVQSKAYDNSNKQMLSIVNLGMNQYSLQFISNQRFLSFSENQRMITTDTLKNKFAFVLRDNGLYTISPAEDLNKVIAVSSALTSEGYTDLVLQDYSGTDNQFWAMNLCATTTIPIIPQVTISKKTLYTGYKKYALKLNQLTTDATVTYSSDHTDIASVSTEGSIDPISKGKAVITIQVNQENNTYVYQVTVTVKDPYIKITTSEIELLSGKSIVVKAKAYGIDNTITWKVSDESIAKIDPVSGKLTARQKGVVTLVAEANDGISTSKEFVVK